MIFIVSLIHIIFIGAIDALIKGNVIAFYNNVWQDVPWYWKDANVIYPASIFIIFGLILAILIMKKTKWGWKYPIMLIIWGLSGLESLSYWFWIVIFNINQKMAWLPDSSFFWWYPPQAAWMNPLVHLKWLSQGPIVTRQGVLYGVLIGFCINLIIYIVTKKKKGV